MFISKILFLVGVFAYAHARGMISLNDNAVEDLKALGKPTPTLYFSTFFQKEEKMFSAVLLRERRVLAIYSGKEVKTGVIYGLSGEARFQERNVIFQSLGKKYVDKSGLGIFTQEGGAKENITPATIAFERMDDKAITEALEKSTIVATFFYPAKDFGDVCYSHNMVNAVQKSSEGNKYTGYVNGPVTVSTPLYLLVNLDNKVGEKIELQLAGVVTKTTPSTFDYVDIEFIAGTEFRDFVNPVRTLLYTTSRRLLTPVR